MSMNVHAGLCRGCRESQETKEIICPYPVVFLSVLRGPGTARTGALHGCRQQQLHGNNIHGETIPARIPEGIANFDKFYYGELLAGISRSPNPSTCSKAPGLLQVGINGFIITTRTFWFKTYR